MSHRRVTLHALDFRKCFASNKKEGRVLSDPAPLFKGSDHSNLFFTDLIQKLHHRWIGLVNFLEVSNMSEYRVESE
jgi:hypothetical protein